MELFLRFLKISNFIFPILAKNTFWDTIKVAQKRAVNNQKPP
jgi:hypothetical protein